MPCGLESNKTHIVWAILRQACTDPKEIDFPRFNMKCSGENVILRGIFQVVSGFPLHFMIYRENLDCFSNSVRHKELCNSVINQIQRNPKKRFYITVYACTSMTYHFFLKSFEKCCTLNGQSYEIQHL